MVKVLGINGSPRKYGWTSLLLNIAMEAAEREGAETEILHLSDIDIKPCAGCLSDNQAACRVPCALDDGMKEVYDKILGSDGLVIATPVYWFAPTGLLKNFLDRLTALENMVFVSGRSLLEGKVAGVIAVGNDSGSVMAASYIMVVLNQMGVLVPPWALAYHNSPAPVDENRGVLIDSANVGSIVARTAKLLADKGVKEWYRASVAWLDDSLALIKKRLERERGFQWNARKAVVEKLLKARHPPFLPPRERLSRPRER